VQHQWSSIGEWTRTRTDLNPRDCNYTGERPRGVYLIHDGDPSHTAAATKDYLVDCHDWWRSRFTPVHASWLDQAEILLNAFSYRYLKRTSWRSRGEFIEHVQHAWPEYNRLYAHPFEWTWTNHKMRRWYADHTP
jgi:hypothetical protein